MVMVVVVVVVLGMANRVPSITTRAYVLQPFKTATRLVVQLEVQIHVNISMFFNIHK